MLSRPLRSPRVTANKYKSREKRDGFHNLEIIYQQSVKIAGFSEEQNVKQ